MKMIQMIMILSILACSGAISEDMEMHEEEMEETTVDTLRLNYLALGDSYTIGQSVAPEERFPNQLMSLEYSEPHKVDEFKIIAQTGWTTRNLLTAMDKEELNAGTYDFITLLIGVNNQYQGLPFQQYEVEFNELMDRALHLLGGDSTRLIVVSIPDYSVTPFASSSDVDKIAEELRRYNDYNKQVAEERGAHYIYITDLTQAAANDPSLLATDGLHPSGKSYGQWVERMENFIELIIKNL